MKKRNSGKREWSRREVNCVTGCSNDCRYCYARAIAAWFKQVTEENWSEEVVRDKVVKKGFQKVQGTTEGGMDIMFPTSHDLTTKTLDACLKVIEHMLAPGNSVLITSKARPECIRAVCDRFPHHNRDGSRLIMFRFTIGAMDDAILRYWDRNAPLFGDRFDSLEYAFRKRFRTSISVEPMLDSDHVVALFRKLKPFVTDSIWIGKVNAIRRRVRIVTPEDERMTQQIEEGQTDERVRAIYAALKHEPLVRWKKSFKQVLGLPLVKQDGAGG